MDYYYFIKLIIIDKYYDVLTILSYFQKKICVVFPQ